MTKVEEPNPTLSTPLVTNYAYYPSGPLYQSEQSGQWRTFIYDYLGRMTSQTLPESGVTSFVYDDDGRLTSKTDARNITTTFGYDNLERPTTRTYSDSTPAVTFGYDASGYTGLRTSMLDGLGSVVFNYDNMNRLTSEQRTLTGVNGTFTTAYAYNKKGDLTQLTYPSGRIVNFNYATGGGCCNSRLASVVDQTTNTTLRSGLTYNAAGELLNSTFGNGVVETFGYNTRLQKTAITATLGGVSLMNFAYDYGTSTTNTGRVLMRTDSIQPEHSVRYVYDSIYRLSQANSADPGTSWAISWTFDVWGNRVTHTPSGLATGKIGAQTSGYANNRNTSYTYDAAGNQTNDGLHNYTFNAENQITSVDGGAVTFGYDGERRRVKKTVGSETTYFFYASIEGIGLISEFTTTNTGATQAASTDKTRYRVADPGGTATLIIDASGLCIENNRTLPYGESWNAQTSSTTENKFSTYVRDPESGLDYAMMRYYASANGRFMSVDPNPEHMDLENPQTLNAYTYVINDPINFDDQNGEFLGSIFKSIGKWLSGLFKNNNVTVSVRIGNRLNLQFNNFSGPQNALIRMFQGRDILTTLNVIGFHNDCWRLLDRVNVLALNRGPRFTLNPMNVMQAVQSAQIMDGTQSNMLYADLWRGTPAHATQLQTFGNLTVAQYLAQPGHHAASSLYGNMIFINPAAVSNDLKSVAALLMHEALHNVDASDQDIQQAWFGKVNLNNTSNIGDRLKKDCIK
jgi:RHS repeat-associated protein